MLASEPVIAIQNDDHIIGRSPAPLNAVDEILHGIKPLAIPSDFDAHVSVAGNARRLTRAVTARIDGDAGSPVAVGLCAD